MKKITRFAAGMVAALSLGILAGCGSTDNVAANNISVDPEPAVVVDWQGRTVGGPQAPAWVANWVNSDIPGLKKTLNIGETDVVKVVEMHAATQAIAQSLARTDVSAQLANGLQQAVIVEAGSAINDQGQREAVERAARAAKAKVSGFSEVSSFWQKTRETDPKTKEIKTEFIQWVAFSSTKDNWERICRIYLSEIAGQGGLQTETQKKIEGMIDKLEDSINLK